MQLSSVESPRVLVFPGSLRLDSLNRKLARLIAAALQASGLSVTFADLRDYPMPIYDGDFETTEGLPSGAKAFKKLFREQDGFVVVTPEYNGSFPALLKNTIDWISRPESGEKPLAVLRGKIAAIASTSPGPGGGRRGLRHVRELLEMIGVQVIPAQLNVPLGQGAFDREGKLARPEDQAALGTLAADLAQVLRQQEIAAA